MVGCRGARDTTYSLISIIHGRGDAENDPIDQSKNVNSKIRARAESSK